jgi:two-component system NtrC family response regulator
MAKILIVEDNPDLCETYTDMLANYGHDIHIVGTCIDATNHLIRNKIPPDVVILDMWLHQESGIVVLGFIRRLPRLARTRVVVVSGYSELADQAVRLWGADVFLPKPVSVDTLRSTIDHYLESSNSMY